MKIFLRIIVVSALISLTLGLTGCGSLGYYYQATKGQLSLLVKRQPISSLIDDASVSPTLRGQLVLADKVRKYGVQQLGLTGNKTFSQYADIERRYVTWNVVAAPEYSVEPKTWCFPIAGCVAYKGFFKESLAQREAHQLAQSGFDVLVYGVSAYSTLGWFDDPLLNTFIHYDDTDLAALIFHELSHQIVYVQDGSEFNEAFATAVEIELLDRWLNGRGETRKINLIKSRREKQAAITEMVLSYRSRLQQAYVAEDRSERKMVLFEEMKQEYLRTQDQGLGTPYYDWWFSRPP